LKRVRGDGEQMEITEKIIGDICIISISGRIDTVTSKDVEAKLDGAIEESKEKIIINLEKMDYISSVGLRVLLAALKKQRQNQRSLQLASLQPFVQNIFKITGLDMVFQIFPTEDAAFKSTTFVEG
jgi:anti-sigma B factor antagonist